jgi:hypothetical protein
LGLSCKATAPLRTALLADGLQALALPYSESESLLFAFVSSSKHAGISAITTQ